MQGGQRVEFANALRGIAAASVLVSHYFGAYWTRNEEISAIARVPAVSPVDFGVPIYVSLLYPFKNFDWGPFGVALFFIISGFVIPFSLARQTFWSFAIGRLIRIYPVYIAGLCVTLAGIYLANRIYGLPSLLTMRQVMFHLPGIRDLAGYPSFDGVIWTLEVETKFYLICALTISLFRKRSLLLFLIPMAIFVAAMLINGSVIDTFRPETADLIIARQAANFIIASHYLIFMFVGVAFHFTYVGRIDFEQAAMLMIVCFSLFVILWSSGPYGAYSSTAWSYGAAVLVFMFFYRFSFLLEGVVLLNFLARISYPLYVCHAVAGYVGLRVLLGYGLPAALSLVIVTVAAVGTAWVIHLVIEVPAYHVSRRLRGTLGASTGPAVLEPTPSKMT